MREIEILKQPIELYKALKFGGMVSSGGEAKAVIAAGKVLLNGKIEITKGKKLASGDIVEYAKEQVRIQFK